MNSHRFGSFSSRHLGPSLSQMKYLLKALKLSSLEEMCEKVLPEALKKQKKTSGNSLSASSFKKRVGGEMSAFNQRQENLFASKVLSEEALSEEAFLHLAQKVAKKNKIFKSYIGQGYQESHTPTLIQRNILENPKWYTSYTPYQAEISQGRMEALFNFQTLVSDLTGMEIANASLLDEGTAAAEAMMMAFQIQKSSSSLFFVHKDSFPQTVEILFTRGGAFGN